MKKEYSKPELEFVNFLLNENITDGFMGGEEGTSELPEDWE